MIKNCSDFRTPKQKTDTRKAAMERSAAIMRGNRAIVLTGKCPDCGAELRRNNSLAGWWQCGRLGAPGFKTPKYEGTGNCSFQCFTE